MIEGLRLMRILDRYVLQKFSLPFVYCFLGFIAIWFIFDLSDNLPDFLQGKAGFDVLLASTNPRSPRSLSSLFRSARCSLCCIR